MTILLLIVALLVPIAVAFAVMVRSKGVRIGSVVAGFAIYFVLGMCLERLVIKGTSYFHRLEMSQFLWSLDLAVERNQLDYVKRTLAELKGPGWNVVITIPALSEARSKLDLLINRTDEGPNQVPEDTARKLADPQH